MNDMTKREDEIVHVLVMFLGAMMQDCMDAIDILQEIQFGGEDNAET